MLTIQILFSPTLTARVEDIGNDAGHDYRRATNVVGQLLMEALVASGNICFNRVVPRTAVFQQGNLALQQTEAARYFEQGFARHGIQYRHGPVLDLP